MLGATIWRQAAACQPPFRGELERELLLRSPQLRDAVLDAPRLPVPRCGALVRSLTENATGDRVVVEHRAA
jgi:hypothetical protein